MINNTSNLNTAIIIANKLYTDAAQAATKTEQTYSVLSYFAPVIGQVIIVASCWC